MRRIVILIVSALIIAGAYLITFGVPSFWGDPSATESAGDAQTGRPTGGPGGRGGALQATTVSVTPLDMQPYESILLAIGSADAVHSASVISSVSGEVIETNLTANQEISAGDVLVQLDARTETFNLEIAQAELDQAREKVERYEKLSAAGNSSIADVSISEARVELRLAEANVGLVQIALDDRTIRAPISGKLGMSDIKVGDVLSVGSDVVTIDDAEQLLVVFELPERAVGLLATGQKVLTTTPTFAGEIFEGEIISFDSRIDDVTRSVTVHALIDNADAQLWPGMTFTVRIVQESEPLALVPATAITWSRDGSSIWVNNDGVAEQVAATILFRRNEQVWIETDLAPGTLVVTEGAQKLRAGSAIAVAGAEGARTGDRKRTAPARAEDATDESDAAKTATSEAAQ
uniref:efflux RND transporter periplasmic adaptor subunit n=1 Tax=Pararhizobium sp. IMCC3301 TaxID=3067904 RepID=UPI0027424A5D|nr:efflux RND transporter periplasmic adaptor subunit [Pararhizobium sp. IMCC3301]